MRNKMDLKEMGCESVDWIQLAQGRTRWRLHAKAVLNFHFHQKQNFFYYFMDYSCTAVQGIRW
jgi:hypothetical protein